MPVTIPDLPWRNRTYGKADDATWKQAKLEARACLVATARRRSVMTYSELRENIVSVRLPASGHAFGSAVGLLLGQVNLDESERLGKPMMLSAVAVKNDLRPGDGFTGLVSDLHWKGDWPTWLAAVWRQYGGVPI